MSTEDPVYKIDLSKMEISTDESMVDEHGSPAKYVDIINEKTLVCHPSMESKLRQAIELFFQEKQNNEEDQNE